MKWIYKYVRFNFWIELLKYFWKTCLIYWDEAVIDICLNKGQWLECSLKPFTQASLLKKICALCSPLDLDPVSDGFDRFALFKANYSLEKYFNLFNSSVQLGSQKNHLHDFGEEKLPLGGSHSRIIVLNIIPRHCPSACHQQWKRVWRTKLVRFPQPIWSPPSQFGLHIHVTYSSVGPSGLELPAGGWKRKRRREMVECEDKRKRKKKKKHCLTLDPSRLVFLAKAAIITRATSNKIVQARLGN